MTLPDLPYCIGIGASGGEGLSDIVRLLSKWPDDLDAAVLVVLHRSSEAISLLPEVLRYRSPMPVEIAVHGLPLRAGTCYVGEPSKILTIGAAGCACVLDGANNLYRNRTIDVLFESMAAMLGARAAGVVLSGSLADGSRGLATIHAAGGATMVLAPGTKPRGMQQNAIEYDGPLTYVGDVDGLVAALRRRWQETQG